MAYSAIGQIADDHELNRAYTEVIKLTLCSVQENPMSSKEVNQVCAIEEMAYKAGMKDGEQDFNALYYGYHAHVHNWSQADAQLTGEIAEEILPGTGADVVGRYDVGYLHGASLAHNRVK